MMTAMDGNTVKLVLGVTFAILGAVVIQNLLRSDDWDENSGSFDGVPTPSFANPSVNPSSLQLSAEGHFLPGHTGTEEEVSFSELRPSFVAGTSGETFNLQYATGSTAAPTEELKFIKTSDTTAASKIEELNIGVKPTTTAQSESVHTESYVSVVINQYIPEQTNDRSDDESLDPSRPTKPSETFGTVLPNPDGTPASRQVCYKDVLQDEKTVCRPTCSMGSKTFSLPGMTSCRPWLTCEDIARDIKVGREIGDGSVKIVTVGWWQNYTVAVSKLKDNKLLNDFMHGLEMLKAFSGSEGVVQLLGFCAPAVYITEYHPLSNALNFIHRLQQHPELQSYNTPNVRMQLCNDYARILAFLHNSPTGCRVMCDSTQLARALHQYLVSNGLRLLLADVDALPKVGPQKVVCGQRQLSGELLAPEQQWPFEGREYSTSHQPPYDEKSDIWKIPEVCSYFLGNGAAVDGLKYHLFEIHKQCKATDPAQRPTAENVVKVYEKVKQSLLSSAER